MGCSESSISQLEIKSGQLEFMRKKQKFKNLGKKPAFKNMCLEGGGVKGLAYSGCLKALNDYDLLEGITNYIGTSAGSGVAFQLALGYDPTEIYDILESIDYTLFDDDSYGFLRDANRLFTEFGWHKGNSIIEFYSLLAKKKNFSENVTFKELYDKTGKSLVATGTNLNKRKICYFSHKPEELSDTPVTTGIRISMGVPLYFKSFKYKDDYWVDGAVLDNFPIHYFDEEVDKHSSETIGFLLCEPDEYIKNKRYEINSLKDFTTNLIGTLTDNIDRMTIGNHHDDMIVKINTAEISATQFSLNDEQKAYLVCQGYATTIDFLQKNNYIEVQDFDTLKKCQKIVESHFKILKGTDK